jgi:phage I-like protein
MLAAMKHLFKAINIELVNGRAPEWVQLLPPGPLIIGRDGRHWFLGPEEMASVLHHFAGDTLELVVDREHASEIKAPKGEEAPAAGWITELADRNGELWGRMEWTERGRKQVEAKEYRYLSPVFNYRKDLRIHSFESAGLTNKPNLHLTALNRQGETMEDDAMRKALCQMLGLPETATDQEIQNAVAKVKSDLGTATNRAMSKDLLSALGLAEDAGVDAATAKAKELSASDASKALNMQGQGEVLDLTKLVPRTDLEMALNRAETAEKAIKERDAKELDAKIELAVNTAIRDGKIAPASKDYYLAMCRKEDGLKAFEDFAKAAPQVIEDPVLPDKPSQATGALTDDQKAICRNMGLDETEFANSLKEGA